MSPKKTAKTVRALREAERAVEKAKAAHRASFRKALVSLFNEYGLCLDGRDQGGSEISELRVPFRLEDLPE
jgi:hypothetical protein